MSDEGEMEQALDELILADLHQAIAKASLNPITIRKGTVLYRFQNDLHTRNPGNYWTQSYIEKKGDTFYFKCQVIEDLYLGRMKHLADAAWGILDKRKFSDKWTADSFDGEGGTIANASKEHLGSALALLRVLSKQNKLYESLQVDGISDKDHIWFLDSQGAETFSSNESILSDAESKGKLIHRGVFLFSFKKINIEGPFDI